MDILGSPIVLGSSIIAGLRQFITEPLKARNPKQFVIGLGYGSLALVKYGSFGCLLALEQVRIFVSSTTAHTLTAEMQHWHSANDMIACMPDAFNCPNGMMRAGKAWRGAVKPRFPALARARQGAGWHHSRGGIFF